MPAAETPRHPDGCLGACAQSISQEAKPLAAVLLHLQGKSIIESIPVL